MNVRDIVRFTTRFMFATALLLAAQATGFEKNWVEMNRGIKVIPPRNPSSRLPLSDQANLEHWVPNPEASDEFEGTTLDSKWRRGFPDWIGHEPGWFSDNDSYVGGGALNISMKYDTPPAALAAAGYHTFSSGAIQTKKRFLYGYYEVKARAMKSHGSSAFFLSDRTAPWWTEIDVFEIGGNSPGLEQTAQFTVHVFETPTANHHWSIGSSYKAGSNLADAYHVYGLDWEYDSIRYYFDGTLVYEGKNTSWHQPLRIIFDSELMPQWYGMPTFNELPSIFTVQYLRAWKRPGKY